MALDKHRPEQTGAKNDGQSDVKDNKTKNRKILVSLLVLFATPLVFAYLAYFGNWFTDAGAAQGELIEVEQLTDIEDYAFTKSNGDNYSGEEFETLYWWIIPLRSSQCDQRCANLNLHSVNQTYLGLGKEALRINELVIFEQDDILDSGKFPSAISLFSDVGVKAIDNTMSGKDLDLPTNFIYLVDPLGNIFMRYPLVKDKRGALKLSKKLRKDILHLFKYSRLG